jgi:non-specific serine/threonine protein kinase
MTLAVAEIAREVLDQDSRIVELGNRSTSGGQVERLFMVQAIDGSNLNSVKYTERDATLRFIGRSRELAELEDRVTRYRLITLSGPAGIGKTTLMRRVLDEMDPLTRSWYLDASNLASPTLLAAALNDTLEIRKSPLQTHYEALLSGAEELDGVLGIDAGARDVQEVRNVVRRLLAIAPNLAIIVASPRSLRLPNESVLPLKGLEVPQGPSNWNSLREYDSVAYFESRATAVVSEFVVSRDNAPAVAMICRRLDGNPAALALAVNKLRVLSPRQILDRLDQPLVFLKGTSEQGPERHQSLQMMIAVTVGPLGEMAKRLLGCMSVVEGAVGFDDVEAMFPKSATLSAFEELVDAGLLDVVGSGIESRRFSMSVSIREFARESMPRDALEEALESRVSYYEQVALQSASGLSGKDQAVWTRRMEEQCVDISSVVRILIKKGELERACMMLVSGLLFWYERNFPSEALVLAEEVLRKKGTFPSHARMENFAAVMALRLGEATKAEEHAKRGLARAVQAGNKRFQIFLYMTHGMISHYKGDFAATLNNHLKAAEIARESGDRVLLYNSVTNALGVDGMWLQGEQFELLLAETLSLESEQTSASWKARLRNNAAHGLLLKGDLVRSKPFIHEALELLLESGMWVTAALTIRTLAHIVLREKRFSDAAYLFGCASELVDHDEGLLTEYEKRFTEEGIRSVIETIGEEAFRGRFNEGRLMEPEEIVRSAIDISVA